MSKGPVKGSPRIDTAAECIWLGSDRIGVPPKAFLVLRRLIEQPGELVTKEILFKAA